MRQIFIKGQLQAGQTALVSGDDHHHLTRSLRAKMGESCLLVDDSGNRFEGVLESASKVEARLKVTQALEAQPELAPLTLALCLPKAEAFDACLDAATQLGVTRFLPLSSARSQKNLSSRMDRWQRIVRESCCQCLRCVPMQILEERRLENFLENSGPGRKFLAWQSGGTPRGRLNHTEPLTFLVGPEGGFEDQEIALAKKFGWEAISLGALVLRVPVALSAGLGLLKAMRQE